MFHLFTPTPVAEKAARWGARVPQYPLVFGFSPFGHLFVCSSAATAVAVIATEKPELVELNVGGIPEFEETFLGNGQVRAEFFRATDYETLCTKLGPLQKEECFYPVPYPVLGGSGSLETYQKGNVWVHLDLYGQSLGLAGPES